jgi:hypothetical protein
MDEFLGNDPRELRNYPLKPGTSQEIIGRLPDDQKVYFTLTADGQLTVSVKYGGLAIRPAGSSTIIVEVESNGEGGDEG